MGYQKQADRSLVYLLPPSVDEWVGPEDPVRFIAQFVEALDLEELGFGVVEEGGPGAPSYGIRMLLSVWLYAYMEKITSSRGLERACRRDMGLIWLTGQHYPDHNTLWRFWSRYRDAVKGVFRQTVLVADKAGLIGTVVQAVDGTKIQARCSAESRWRQKSLEEKLLRIDASIAEAEALIDSQAEGEELPAVLPEDLQSAGQLRTAISQILEEMKEQQTKDLHPDEPEARLMRTRGNSRMCYNAQAMVDYNHQIIVGTGLDNQANDMHWLVPMLQQTRLNLPQRAVLTLGDAGYDTITELYDAEQAGDDVLVNEKRAKAMRENEFHSAHFIYDEENQEVICPHTGHILSYSCLRKSKKKIPNVHSYRCYHRSCPLREKCCPKTPKQIDVSEHHKSLFRQQKKRQSVSGKFLLAYRKAIVELAFARIKQQMDFRRFTFSGMKAAQAQWNMVCAAYNIKRMAARWAKSKSKTGGMIYN